MNKSEFIYTLFHHRAIIKGLRAELKYTRENARDVINLIGKEGLRGKILSPESSFSHHFTMTRDGIIYAGFACVDMIPPLRGVERAIQDLKNYERKKEKKGKIL